ncbi:MAG: glycosyltransferase family 4 protein [Thermoleophilaceae bacterium]
MRILAIGSMYPPHYLGGQELLWRDAVRHQRAAGHDVRVLTTDYRRDDAGEELDDDVHRELRWYWRDHAWPHLSRLERLALERHNARVLDRHLAELRPDAVAWWALGGMSLSLLERVRRSRVPGLGVVCENWMVYADEVDAWMRLWARLRPVRAVAATLLRMPTRFEPGRAARWIFISEHIRRRALEHRNLPDTAVIHPGVDRTRFAEREPRPWGRRLLYMGRIDPRKGIDIAVRAVAGLPSGATLTIDGWGDEGHLRELRALVTSLGLGDRVSFQRSPRERLAGVYAEADAVLFPVRWDEPWGLVPLEAMAVGRPVVGTGRGGSGEYLREGENCLLFDPDEGGPAALAAAVRRLGEDEELREHLRAGGLATAAGLTEDAFNDALLRELEALAS